MSNNNNNNNNRSEWNSSSNTYKKINEHGKNSFLEEVSVRNIGTRPDIFSHVSPIGQNKVTPK